MKHLAPPSVFFPHSFGSFFAGMLLVSFAATDRVHAIQIHADLTNIADFLPGQDAWRASYTISGGTFSVDQGFTLFFDPSLYANLSSPLPPVSSDWDVLTVQPDLLLNAPGFLDGVALVNGASLSQPFIIDFAWLGTALPGSQGFELYDQSDNFQTIGSGQTFIRSIDAGGGGSKVPDYGSTIWLAGISMSAMMLFSPKQLFRRNAH